MSLQEYSQHELTKIAKLSKFFGKIPRKNAKERSKRFSGPEDLENPEETLSGVGIHLSWREIQNLTESHFQFTAFFIPLWSPC